MIFYLISWGGDDNDRFSEIRLGKKKKSAAAVCRSKKQYLEPKKVAARKCQGGGRVFSLCFSFFVYFRCS